MNQFFVIVIAVLLFSSVADAADWRWTKTDTTVQATWTALHILDWSQTRKIAKEPGLYWERNPILGKHPSVGKVDTYMAISTVANFGIARALPKPYRRYFQVISIGVSGGVIIMNFNIGLRGGDWF